MFFQLSEWVFYSILLRMINISTPSRICLFGEHQDYLGLPVAATSISLRSIISGKKRDDKQVIINLPDINKKEMFYIDQLDYQNSLQSILIHHFLKKTPVTLDNLLYRNQEHL